MRSPAPRIWLIDAARSLALLGMVVFHATFDLQTFGLVAPDTTTSGFFWYFSRAVAGSFLLLAGMSLWLSHGDGIRWRAFGRRWWRIALAAAAVSLATWLALGPAFVFFGILHAIALSSLIGLAFLRLPVWALLAAGAAVIGGAYVLPGLLAWNAAPLRFLGLGTIQPFTVDFEPVFPWFGPFLLGIGLARLLAPHWSRLARIRGPEWLAWPGRHSLAVYLLHQPVLIGMLWLGLQVLA